MNTDLNNYEKYQSKNWGFHKYNEKINGRLAMLTFLVIIIIEIILKTSILKLF
ncbi:unnamed protein product [Choristocarpus tenellus]|uniref:hypothetical protein n=1 Tax=Choristocarpus tenellus TaxID=116065 RepID=UPI002E79FFB4|nr:hypothetical protein V2478_pgp002 [Choristocarpus tenellus]WAM62413.1 hypothetical protein [Choristocarpus tenellus]